MKLLIVACRIFLLFLSLELCARVDDLARFGANFWKPYTRETTIEMADKFGATGKPNSRYQKWRINNLGFRGMDMNGKKKEGVVRVLCAGASETFGLYEDAGKEWPMQLESRLKNSGAHSEVINASFYGPGYTFHNIARRFKEFWTVYEPDYLIVYASPLSYMYEFKDSAGSGGGDLNGRSSEIKKTSTFNLRIIDKIKNAYRKYLPQWLLDAKDKRKFIEEIEINRTKDSRQLRSLSEAKGKMRQDILSLKDLCEKNHIILVLSSHVMRSDDVAVLQSRAGFPKMSEEEIVKGHQELNSFLKKIALENNILFVDNAVSCEATISHLADNAHFTNEGAAAVADNFYIAVSRLLGTQKRA